jgi:hypothetical protein
LVRPDQQTRAQSNTHAYAKADPNSNPHTSIKPWKRTILAI